jgi:hypothetical protein
MKRGHNMAKQLPKIIAKQFPNLLDFRGRGAIILLPFVGQPILGKYEAAPLGRMAAWKTPAFTKGLARQAGTPNE